MSGSQTSSQSSDWTPPTVEELHALLPQYEIDAILGRGGMGAVYKGHQEALGRTVAIKVLPETLIDNDDDHQYAERFKLEARSMANLDHPAIISVHDFGQTSAGHLYFVMEFIDGMDIEQYISASGGTVEPEHAIAIVSHVLDALAYAHSKGIIHRDIKPANVLINSEGRVKIADFGLAKEFGGEGAEEMPGLTMTNVAMGTPDYIAPEALDSEVTPDHRADLFAVGVMLYRMLTGKLPRGMFRLPSEEKPELDPRFDEVISRGMAGRPEDRYQNATEFRSQLDGLLTQPVTRIKPEQDTESVSPPARQLNVGAAATQAQVKKAPAAKTKEKAPQPKAAVSRSPKKKKTVAAAEKRTSPALLFGLPVACLGIAGIVFFATRGGNEGGNQPPPARAEAPASGGAEGDKSNGSNPSRPGRSAKDEETAKTSSETEVSTWPSGPHYASEGKFRAWSSEANDPVLDLIRLRGIDDVEQVCAHENGWIVLRNNGETISHDGSADWKGIRKICPSFGGWFSLITDDGEILTFNKAGPVEPDEVMRTLPPAADCWIQNEQKIALLESGEVHLWGQAFEGTSPDPYAHWNAFPKIPGDRNVSSISARPGALAIKFGDGELMAWHKVRGRIDLPEEFGPGRIGKFEISLALLVGVPYGNEKPLYYQWDKGEVHRFAGPATEASIDLLRAGNGEVAITVNGGLTPSGHFHAATPSAKVAFEKIHGARPALIAAYLNAPVKRAHLIWFEEPESSVAETSPPVNDSIWPNGPHYASEGRFRAWTLDPEAGTLDLSRLRGIGGVEQIHLHETGWVVLPSETHTLALRADGEWFGWGKNEDRLLDDLPKLN